MKDTLRPAFKLLKVSDTYWQAVMPKRYHHVFKLGYQERTGLLPRMKPAIEDMNAQEHDIYRHGVEVAADRLARPNWKQIAVVLDWEEV